ncbi:MAG: tetratricopeptide repeat protein [Candidatus Acidoferrales bacterium]
MTFVMGFRRPTPGFLSASLLLLFLWGFPARAQTVLVVPFENASQAADLDWVGESFSETLNQRLGGFGHFVVPREDRLDALQRLGLRHNLTLTYASSFRLAEEVGARWVILGRFRLTVGELQVQARVLDLRAFTLSPWLEVRGSFHRLLSVQTRLAWTLLRQFDPTFPFSFQAFQQRFPPREVSAFESYVRGLLAFDPDQQLRYFLQAARSDPAYPASAFRLGRLYFEQQDYPTAAGWFETIPEDHPRALDARFYLSLCRYFAQDFSAAVHTLAPLAEQLPARPLWNNLGVFASRGGSPQAAVDSFHAALEDGPDDPDIYFNLGLHYLRQQNWTDALQAFDECLALNSHDLEAHFLRSRALQGLGRSQEAERARERALGDNPALARSLERHPLELDRLQEDFRAHSIRFQLRRAGSAADRSSRQRHVALHIERGEDLLARGQLEAARLEFTEAILLDPGSYRAHFLLAEIYNRQGRLADAISELKASLWSQESVSARLRLAELYLLQKRPGEARAQVAAALALDPTNPDAQALQTRLAALEREARTEGDPSQ